MHKVFLISFLSVFITTISTTAFEDSNTNNIKLDYKLNVRQFELQLDYCNSFDSFIINKLYSEKKIELNYLDNLVKKKDRVIVNIKTKPINNSIIEQGHETAKINSFNIDFVDTFNFEDFSILITAYWSHPQDRIQIIQTKPEFSVSNHYMAG